MHQERIHPNDLPTSQLAVLTAYRNQAGRNLQTPQGIEEAMSDKQHTPTPWHVTKWIQTTVVHSEKNLAICSLSNKHKNANAEFIVLACNSHAALLEACKLANTYLQHLDGTNASDDLVIIEKLRAAIALAEKGNVNEEASRRNWSIKNQIRGC
jgi:hypothetical protein